jgi:hypothetical protein
MHCVIFVGPSLEHETVRALFPGEVRPPIKRGDLDQMLAAGALPDYVGIVDGQFLHAPSISPKEVLRAIDHGAELFGSSSIGALRAAECAPFGMVGVGRIFRMYASAELDADDEVAVVYNADTLQALSEPMVNIRVALRAAADAGLIAAESEATLVAVAEQIYFPSRTYANVLHAARGLVDDGELAAVMQFVTGGAAPDQKRSDALELIAAIRTRSGTRL